MIEPVLNLSDPLSTVLAGELYMPTRRTVDPEDTPIGPQRGVENWGVSVPSASMPANLMQTEESEEDSLVAQVRAKLAQTSADGARFKLYRFHTLTKQREFCDDMAVDSLDEIETLIRNTFGPGAYELRLITSTGVAGRWPLRIAELPSIKSAAAPPSELSQMLGVIAAGQQQMADALTRLASAPPPPQKSSAESMTEMLTMMKLMREAMGAGAAAPAASPLSSIKESLELIRELKGTAAEIAGDTKEADESPMGVLMQFLGVAKEAIQAQRGAPAPYSPAATPFPSVSLPPSLQQPAPDPGDGSDEDDPEMFKRDLAHLESMMQNGASVEDAGAYLYQNLPAMMVPLIDHPDFMQAIGQFSPVLAGNPQWCTAVRDVASRLFKASGG